VSTQNQPLCWKASDYLYWMSLTNYDLYSQCNVFPYLPSNGTAGCMGYLSNPDLYVEEGLGTMDDWIQDYDDTCGVTFKGAHNEFHNARNTKLDTFFYISLKIYQFSIF
jgi:hypothetical protein